MMAPAVAVSIPQVRRPGRLVLGQLDRPVEALASQSHTESDEFDFSDVFGPAPQTHLASVKEGEEADWGPPELHYEGETLVICSRSHSLVGPSPRPSFSKLRKLALDDPDRPALENEASALSAVEKEWDVNNLNSDDKDVVTGDSPEAGGVLGKQFDDNSKKLGPHDFELLRVVGQGAFGKVFQVRKEGSTEIYAMKVMRKDKIMEKNHADYMKAERDILTKVVHPFIVQLRCSFQTKTKLYLILDFINGGHLFFQLYRQGIFSEELGRLYAAEIVCAVAHLHSNGIVHRDLKPENILLDADGHVKLTDFGLAKEIEEFDRTNSLCGTMEYMAPEILLSKGHGKAADWWSLGILLYEMLTGQPPFTHSNKHQLQQKIVKDKIKLPKYLTSEAHLLLKGLLQKDPDRRLGSGENGSSDIKQHKWFKSINWKKLEARQIQPNFKPEVQGRTCIANFDEKWTNLPPQDSPASTPRAVDCDLFQGYTYVAPNEWLPESV